jgi:fermentation-respiration switch protein FrsA (DUF1100 family)
MLSFSLCSRLKKIFVWFFVFALCPASKYFLTGAFVLYGKQPDFAPARSMPEPVVEALAHKESISSIKVKKKNKTAVLQAEDEAQQARPPRDLGSSIEVPVTIKTKDGIERNGILTIRKNALGNVLLCHAAGYDKTTMEPFVDKVFKEYNCLRFDFRRHGENSKDQYSTIGRKEIYEVQAAVEFLKTHEATKGLDLYGFGHSMGAAALIHAEAMQPTFKGLILQSCFEKLRTQIKHHFSIFRWSIFHGFVFTGPVRLFAKWVYRIKAARFNPVDLIGKVKAPLFLIHAENDTFTPFDAYLSLTKAAHPSNLKETWAPKLGGHSKIFSTYPELYCEKCIHFLRGIC